MSKLAAPARISFALLLAGFVFSTATAAQGFRQAFRVQGVAQRKQGKNPPPEADKAAGAEKFNEGQGDGRALVGVPPKWVARLREMSPEEQERFLRNNARFRSLPPERQAQIRANLQRWNSLTPQQRNAIRDRERLWERLTPEQREYVRTQLLPKWQTLPPQRKEIVQERLRDLRGLSEADRQSKLTDENFLRGLDPDEREILRGLSNLRIPPNPNP